MSDFLTISPLPLTQLPLVAQLARAIWPVAYKGILTEAQIGNLLDSIYSADSLQAEADSGHRFWGAFEGEKALGFASAYREENAIWLRKLYVRPEAQGKNIGKRLMEQSIGAFLPAKEVRILTNVNNAQAITFYERQGFKITEEIPVKMGDFQFRDYLLIKNL